MATNFGAANPYNVLVFDALNLKGSGVEGLVAVGGAVAQEEKRDSSVDHAPMHFLKVERYLKHASVYWATLEPNGVGKVVSGDLNLTGTDDTLNVFSLEGTDVLGSGVALDQLRTIHITAPLSSTILINVTGPQIQYGDYQLIRNGMPVSPEHARKILWNFPEALTWANGFSTVYGSILAPFADAVTTSSKLNGTIIFSSLSGTAEVHNELFEGELPEPALCALYA